MQIQELNSYERTLVPEGVRLLLCDFAAGDLERPLRHLDVDWEQVFAGVCRNGLLGLSHRYLRLRATPGYPPASFVQSIKRAYRKTAFHTVLVYQDIRKVLAHLSATDVDYMVLKGPALAHCVYPDPVLRDFNDLDLLVRERDWEAMHRALIDVGFEPEEEYTCRPPKLVPRDVLYECKYRHPVSGLLVEVHYDDLLNAGLATRNLEGFWQRAIEIRIEEIPVKTLCLHDQLIHLAAHLHYHGYTRLNWFSDLAFILRDHGSEIDWSQLVQTVRIEEAQIGVYYSLLFVQRLLDVPVPEKVLALLRPSPRRRWLHERYMPASKVLSLAPMPRPDLSFYFRPFLKRLLPDLLIMGRGGEKLRYLARLLVPPAAWLKHYYHLQEGQPVGVHYVLHPLKLLYHSISELAAAAARLLLKQKVAH